MNIQNKIEILRNLKVDEDSSLFLDVVYRNERNAYSVKYLTPYLKNWLEKAKLNDPEDFEFITKFAEKNYDFTSELIENGKTLDTFWHKNQYPGKSFIEYKGRKFIAFYGGDDYYSIISDEF